jgi:hypothetical protein
MPRRPATLTQSDVARAIRAARSAGADAIEVRPDGTIRILLNAPPTVPEQQTINDDWTTSV